jgi:hypothetical protein
MLARYSPSIKLSGCLPMVGGSMGQEPGVRGPPSCASHVGWNRYLDSSPRARLDITPGPTCRRPRSHAQVR